MKNLRYPLTTTFAALAVLVSAAFTPKAEAARGRPTINAAKTTFVADNGSLLRGAQMATDMGGTYSTSTISAIKNYGCNAVHLYAERSDQGYAAGAKASIIDGVVAATRDAGLYLIITIGNGGGATESFTTDFWNFYAGRYANETHVLYEIHNEATGSAPSSAAVITMEKNCYNIIRSKAPNTPVLLMTYVAFNSGAAVIQDVNSLGSTVNWNNAAIAFHGYGSGGRAGCRACLQYVLNAGYPCFQTEFYQWPWGMGNFNLGDGASMYQNVDEMGDFERLHVSWLSFITLSLVTNDTRFKNRIENAGILWTPDCGTWPSGSRSVHGNGGEPWTTSLSGTLHIEAEDFDNGGQGISYNDSATGNNGGKYRTTEGVDIESTTDTGGGYDVGWIVTGEWLEYTTYITDAAWYTLKIRVASPNASNSLRVSIGGTDVTGAWTFGGTGGYQNWTTITKTVALTPGQQIMHIDMLSSNFNLNWIELTPVSSGTVANGTYKLINRGSGMSMDVVNASTANGAKIQQWNYAGNINQKWVLTHKAGNQYTVTSAQTGKGIDESSGTALDGNYIAMWDLWNGTGSANQRWLLIPTDSGYYKIVSANSGLVLDITGSASTDGAIVDQNDDSGSNYQQWSPLAP